MYKSFLIVLALLASGVIPTPTRPRTKRMSRGPAWTNFQNLVVSDDVIQQATALRQGQVRVALVSAADDAPGETATDETKAPAMAVDVAREIIRTGLRYGQNLILTTRDTETDLFAAGRDPTTALPIARAADIDFLVFIDASEEPMALSLRIARVVDGQVTTLPVTPLADLNDAVIDAAVAARSALLESFGAFPRAHQQELAKRPQASYESLSHLLKAREHLAAVAATEPDQDQLRMELCERALSEADEAVRLSPDFLEAYLVQASCEDELDRGSKRDESLAAAKRRSRKDKHDLLTFLEAQGDYARFVEQSNDAADRYGEILQIDPANQTALWSMLDLILFSGEAVPGLGDPSLPEAVSYAARIVALHPNSRLAKAIRD